MIKNNNKIEILGWYGAIAVLLAYALLSFGVINSGDLVYQLLNFTGALGIMLVSLAKGVMQTTVINIVWSLLALAAKVNIILG